jgi:hypothetical protein
MPTQHMLNVVSLRIHDPLHDELRALARQQSYDERKDVPFAEVCRRALQDYARRNLRREAHSLNNVN